MRGSARKSARFHKIVWSNPAAEATLRIFVSDASKTGPMPTDTSVALGIMSVSCKRYPVWNFGDPLKAQVSHTHTHESGTDDPKEARCLLISSDYSPR